MAIAAGLIHGCRTQRPPEFPVTPACLEQARVQHSFVELARYALQAFGRIDPLLYQVDSGGKLGLDPNAKERDGASREQFMAALGEIQKDEQLSLAFKANLDQALKDCAGQCEAKAYPIDVQRVDAQDPDIFGYTYALEADPPPTDAELKAFEQLYSHSPPDSKDCRAPDPVAVQDPTHGVLLAFVGGLCVLPWPPPSENHECAPPAGGHWRRTPFLAWIFLCCR